MTNDRIPMIPPHKVISMVRILAEKLDYNHALMNVPHMWQDTKGAGVKLAVLDTGLPNHVDIKPCGSFSAIPHYLDDENGHATHVAGIIAAVANNGMGVAGIAPDVEDYYGAVLDGDGSGSMKAIVEGIEWAVDEVKADIINMSLGIPAGQRIEHKFERACAYAFSKGVTIIAAAGNEAGGVGQPASYDSTTAVAAIDDEKQHASFSNTGPEVDFATGGVNVYSTYLNNSYAKLSGTSMAAPALAAIVALIKAKHRADGVELGPAQLRDHLQKISYDVGPEGFDETFGHGLPVFGKHEDPQTYPAVPDEQDKSPEQPDDKKSGPRANCVYWRMWGDFISSVNGSLDDDPDLKKAIVKGIRSVGRATKATNKALRQSN